MSDPRHAAELDGETIDWESTDRVYVLAMKERANEMSRRIRRQITAAKRKGASGNGFAPRDWMRKAEHALHAACAISQRLQNRLSEMRKQKPPPMNDVYACRALGLAELESTVKARQEEGWWLMSMSESTMSDDTVRYTLLWRKPPTDA